jgi:uncharacterized membrane protein YgdD (TMEM256/DUF423 family)
MQPSARVFIASGAMLMALGVLAAAFGAHGLEHRTDAAAAATYRTAVEWHIHHALGLIIVGLVAARIGASRTCVAAGTLMAAGVVLFSGSLYLTALAGIREVTMLAPVGGLCFAAGWVSLAIAIVRHREPAH